MPLFYGLKSCFCGTLCICSSYKDYLIYMLQTANTYAEKSSKTLQFLKTCVTKKNSPSNKSIHIYQ